ncbi:hypothetical protein BHE74_00009507 [Ensete ventricosum]|nr:hypothetical protein BHE74_00009507 [Ensete ventricosum]
MRLGTHLECAGSLHRVLGACQDGVREFAGRRPRLAGRLSGVAEKLTGSRKEGVEGLYVAIIVVLVLQASWLSHSSWIQAKEITAI